MVWDSAATCSGLGLDLILASGRRRRDIRVFRNGRQESGDLGFEKTFVAFVFKLKAPKTQFQLHRTPLPSFDSADRYLMRCNGYVNETKATTSEGTL